MKHIHTQREDTFEYLLSRSSWISYQNRIYCLASLLFIMLNCTLDLNSKTAICILSFRLNEAFGKFYYELCARARVWLIPALIRSSSCTSHLNIIYPYTFQLIPHPADAVDSNTENNNKFAESSSQSTWNTCNMSKNQLKML